ncbi:hypothetical protein J3R82DRAFT_6609 [Butyriboletus roseoflavus]|nr:hypothetical protein J3R82DRAFT_6609 [Butyriboletus roseoflavus]
MKSDSRGPPPDVDFSYFGGAESLAEGKRSPRRTVVASPTVNDDGRSHPGPPQDPADFLWLMTEEAAPLSANGNHESTSGRRPAHGPRTSHQIRRPSSRIPTAFCCHTTPTLTSSFFLVLVPRVRWLAVPQITIFSLPFMRLPTILPSKASTLTKHWLSLRTYLLEYLILLHSSTFQVFFYALRPGFVRTQRLTKWHFINLVAQLMFDYVFVQTFGIRPLLYLLFSSFFAGSLHPCAGHFIAEHYVWDGLNQETYSYYGPLNVLAYNVGYHNEHHDFPSIPWTRLPALRALAPEVYDSIPCAPKLGHGNCKLHPRSRGWHLRTCEEIQEEYSTQWSGHPERELQWIGKGLRRVPSTAWLASILYLRVSE